LINLIGINNSMDRFNNTIASFAHTVLHVNLFPGAGVGANRLPVADIYRLMSDSHAYQL
jgi:hypothetical protein